MAQARIFLRAPQAVVRQFEAAIAADLEADGLAIAAFEIDEARRLWEVAVYCDSEAAGEVRARLQSRLPDPRLTLEVEELPETDWVARSLGELKPVAAGRYFVHGSHDRAARRPWHLAIEIDAGEAFGTGHHGTTAGCLIALDRELRRRRPRRVLDLGTGSGVLAMAIAKSLRRPVVASDIDPAAVAVARSNVRINGVGRLVNPVAASGFRHRRIGASTPYELIVANILARPLQKLAPDFARHAAPGATVILSGLLADQFWQVIAAFRTAGFALGTKRTLDGWATLVLRRS